MPSEHRRVVDSDVAEDATEHGDTDAFQAARGTDVFLELSETTDERLFVHNDVSQADQALVADNASFDVST